MVLWNLSIRDLGFKPGLFSGIVMHGYWSLFMQKTIMARKIEVIVETGKDGFGCFMSNKSDDLKFGINGMGKTVKAAIDDFYMARDEMYASLREEGKEVPELDFHFVMDVGAFLNYYPINVTSFAKYIGMNASLLRQYASGLKVPKEKSLEKIKAGIQQVAKDIAAGRLIDRPVTQYI